MTELPDHIINIHGHLHESDDMDGLVREWAPHNKSQARMTSLSRQ